MLMGVKKLSITCTHVRVLIHARASSITVQLRIWLRGTACNACQLADMPARWTCATRASSHVRVNPEYAAGLPDHLA